ncbi:hypothetical protein [Argonema galeatum]|nr:hypothetical protein [Argonema galeatum]
MTTDNLTISLMHYRCNRTRYEMKCDRSAYHRRSHFLGKTQY